MPLQQLYKPFFSSVEHFLLLERFDIPHRKINKITWAGLSEISGKQCH
jgi:hypothetical protein